MDMKFLMLALSFLPLSALACEKPQVSGYGHISCLSENLASVEQNGKYGFMDPTGKIAIPIQYDFAIDFSAGLAVVDQHGKSGFIDKMGKTIIPFEYDDAWSFSEGLASVEKKR